MNNQTFLQHQVLQLQWLLEQCSGDRLAEFQLRVRLAIAQESLETVRHSGSLIPKEDRFLAERGNEDRRFTPPGVQ